jgi:alpha-beta hydrolase superfamily lysophospholipase
VGTTLVTLNLVLFCQARALTHFQRGAPRLPKVEQLPLGQRLQFALLGPPVGRPENDKTPADYRLEFFTETVTVRPGIELELWRVPAGEPRGTVLLLHGYTDSKSRMLPDALIFHELGFTAVLVDFRGSGGSSASHTSLGVEEAEDVAAVWQTLPADDGPRILCGRSMGSVAALRAMAVHGVRPTAAILESPFDRLTTAIRRRCELVGIPATPIAELLCVWGGVQHGFNPFDHNATDYARAVECPVLLLRGERDTRVQEGDLQAIAVEFPRPPVCETFPGAGHDSCCRHDRPRFQRVIRDFLASLESSGRNLEADAEGSGETGPDSP